MNEADETAGAAESCSARVEYPEESEVLLLETPFRLACQEGLFGYLQRVGWLHPYDAVWSGTPGGTE